MVENFKFGIGKIISISNHGENTHAQIDFHRVGVKTLLVELAPLKIPPFEPNLSVDQSQIDSEDGTIHYKDFI